jgi:hypothetical protein
MGSRKEAAPVDYCLQKNSGRGIQWKFQRFAWLKPLVHLGFVVQNNPRLARADTGVIQQHKVSFPVKFF